MADVGEITIKGVMDPEAVKALALAMESAHRRDLVGGLIRYLKDRETDLGRLLFHYVHVEDYGQAMVEGWGELHGLLTGPPRVVGSMGLPFEEVGELAQALGSCLVDRDYPKDQVLDALEDFSESSWWETVGGPMVDSFANWLMLGDPDEPDFEPFDASDSPL